MRTILSGLVTFGACNAARWYLDRDSRKSEEYAHGHVQMTKLWNDGAAFGLKIPREVLLSVSGAVLGTVWMTRHRSPVGAGLILGGGLSNLGERLMRGEVYDYVQFPKAPWKVKKYVYNLADIAIAAGGIAWALGKKH